jgi:hypothetical protein
VGADYVIQYGCVPKEVFTTPGLLSRVKSGERAIAVRRFYHEAGEDRPPEEMGFEMVYRSADGAYEKKLLRLDEMLAERAELNDYEGHCVGCPANAMRQPFGCIGTVNYPISAKAEFWMLQQLPAPEQPVPYLLLMQGREFGNTGQRAEGLRDQSPGVFFESEFPLMRRYDESDVSGEQLFELMFLSGHIPTKRAAMILLFMAAISQDIPPDELMALTPPTPEITQRYPFLLEPAEDDDNSIRDLKQFFHALYVAMMLDREVLLDV